MTAFISFLTVASMCLHSVLTAPHTGGDVTIPIRSRRHVALLPPYHNVCPSPSSERVRIGQAVSMETIFDKTMEFKQKLGIEINQFKRQHISCGATLTYLDSLTLEHFVHIQQPSFDAENLIFEEYMRLSVVEYLIKILTSSQAQECCVAVPDVHHHLRHRVLSKWRQHVSVGDTAVLEGSCLIRADVVVNLGRDCSDMRNLVYVLLRHVEREIDGSILTLDFLRG